MSQNRYLTAVAPAGWALAATLLLGAGCENIAPQEPEPSGPALDAALYAGKALNEYFTSNIKVLDQLLGDLEKDRGQTADLAAKLAAARDKLPERAPVAVFDANRHLIAADLPPEGLPPAKVVMPTIRRAILTDKPVLSSVWLGSDKHFWVAQAQIRGKGPTALVALTAYRAAGPTMTKVFASLQKAGADKLQVLDTEGMAVWSTDAAERFKTAVHGTYLLDKLHTGKPFQTKCHSCHENGKQPPIRTEVNVTVVPVPATSWSITVR